MTLEKGQKLYRFKLDMERETFERHVFEVTDVNRRGWAKTTCPANPALKFMMGIYFDPDTELGTVKTWQSCKYVMLAKDDPVSALEIMEKYILEQLEDQKIVVESIQRKYDTVLRMLMQERRHRRED